jgi:O-antigen/teichoic acid export membrane protein
MADEPAVGDDALPSADGRPTGALRTMTGLIVSRGFVAIAGFIGSALWARSFDQDTYGKYQIIAAAGLVVASFTLPGLNDAALISSAKRKDGNLDQLIRLRLAVSLIGGLVLAAWGVLRYRDDSAMLLGFVISAVLFVPLQLQPLWIAFTNGKRRFRLLTIGQTALAAGALVGIAAFTVAGATSPAMLPWVILASQGLTVAVGLYLQLMLREMRESTERDPAIVRYGHHVTAAFMLAWVFSSDRLIVGELMSSSDVALLSVALVMPNQVKIFFAAFEQVFLPSVTAASSVADAWDYIRPRFVRLWALYTVLGAAGVFLLPIAIPIFFSSRYVEAVPYAKWLWLSLCLSSPFTFLASILNSQRDKRFLYVKNLASPIFTIALFAVLIPRYGLAGAVVARITNHAMLVVLHIAYFAYAVRRARDTSGAC